MNNIKTELYPTTIKPKSANPHTITKRTKIVTAGNQTRAPWMETTTPKTSYTKLKLLHQPHEKHTSGFATPHLN